MRLSTDIRVRLEPDVALALRERAAIERRSLANLTRVALEDYLQAVESRRAALFPEDDAESLSLAAEERAVWGVEK